MNIRNKFIEPIVYAGWNLNDKIRYNSSSGGIFTSLASLILEEGGTVYGVAYDKELFAHHVRIDSVEELYMIRGSKYIESQVFNTYQDVIDDLKKGKKVLFSGTPCQTAAINNIVGDNTYRDRLITVDVLCHGVASPLAWKYYLEDISQEKGSIVAEANMRDKTYGWFEGCVKLTMDNGQEYKEHFRNGIWGFAFYTNLFLRDSCYNCSFKKKIRTADISLGDFWGATKENSLRQYDDHDKGTSVILINSSKGMEYLDKVADCHLERISYECLLNGTYVLYKSSEKNYFSKWAFKSLGGIPFSQIIEKTKHPSTLKRIQRKLWNIFVRNYSGKFKIRTDYKNSEQRVVNEKKADYRIPILYETNDKCCGCFACFSVCSFSAISMRLDEKGFFYPVIDIDKCQHCNACLRVCPIKTADSKN